MTARKAPLRAVKPGERKPAPPQTVSEAAATGTTRDLLVTMRDRIAKTVEDVKCPPRDLASLSRRLMEIAKEIEQLDAQDAQEVARSGSVADEAFSAEAL